MLPPWFGDLAGEGDETANSSPGKSAEQRTDLPLRPGSFTPADWRRAVACGAVRDRRDYIRKLRELCIGIARKRMEEALGSGEEEVIRMIGVLDTLILSISLLSSRVEELRMLDGCRDRLRDGLEGEGVWSGRREILDALGEELERMHRMRLRLAQDVAQVAERVAPNCSALLGGVVAGRLIARAGGLGKLARMPSSSIQVLGAERALFAHLHTGSGSPKHGIIYQHKRIHHAPRRFRGRISRVLAARLAIAARIDYYRGELAPEFIKDADRRLQRVGRGDG